MDRDVKDDYLRLYYKLPQEKRDDFDTIVISFLSDKLPPSSFRDALDKAYSAVQGPRL